MSKYSFVVLIIALVGFDIDASAQNKLFFRNGVLIDVESATVDSTFLTYTRDGEINTVKNKKIFAYSTSEGTDYFYGFKARGQRNKAPLFYPMNKRWSLAVGQTLSFVSGANVGLTYFLDENSEYELGAYFASVYNTTKINSQYYLRFDARRFVTLQRRFRYFYGVSITAPKIVAVAKTGIRAYITPNISLESLIGFGYGHIVNVYDYDYGFYSDIDYALLFDFQLAYHFNIPRKTATPLIQ